MKRLASVLCVIATLSLGSLSAAQISHPQGTGPSSTANGASQGAYNSKRQTLIKPFSPQASGALVALYNKGPVMISPGAPASEGLGQNFLSTHPSELNHHMNNIGDTSRDFGGVKLLGMDF